MNRWSCVVLLFAIMGFSPLAGAYWDEAWTARVKITLNPQGVSAAVDNIPVPVRLHSGNFHFLNADADGADLRFISADDKTELTFHIEKYDSVNELALIWVLLPKVNPADKTAHFWLYYGNDTATPVAEGGTGWDSLTTSIFHFSPNSLISRAATFGMSRWMRPFLPHKAAESLTCVV